MISQDVRKTMKPFLKTVVPLYQPRKEILIPILFSLSLVPFIPQKGWTQTIEISKDQMNSSKKIETNFSLSNHRINITSEAINLSTDQLSNSEFLANSESLNSSNIHQNPVETEIPIPNDPTISQRASDLQFQAQIKPEENQQIIEDSQEVNEENKPTESSSSQETNLAEESQNPIANLISVPFQNNTNFGVGQLDRTQNILNIQPVIPIDINEDWLLVSRTILPIIYQPALTQTQYSHFGLGDLNPQLFFVPKNNSKITWGVGPVFLLPTATDDSLGTGKWGIGPTGVIVVTDAPWVYGALVNNIWSVAGDSNRPDVSQFLLQVFINYNLANGWYLVSAPIITANWNASSGNQWTVPIGGGMGRIFNIGKQPVNVSLQGYWNAETPEGGADWTLRTQFQLLFPK